MDNLTFNKTKRQLNKEYRELFGVIPCMQDFRCSREEYVEALKKAIENKTEIEKLLPAVGKPMDKNSLI